MHYRSYLNDNKSTKRVKGINFVSASPVYSLNIKFLLDPSRSMIDEIIIEIYV